MYFYDLFFMESKLIEFCKIRFNSLESEERKMDEIREVNDSPEFNPKRGGWLTTFLILMFIGNPVSLIFLFAASLIKNLSKNSPIWVIPVLGVSSIINIICAIGIWKWKKWGVYGLVITTLIVVATNISIGISINRALLGFIGLAIIIFLVNPLWKYFENY